MNAVANIVSDLKLQAQRVYLERYDRFLDEEERLLAAGATGAEIDEALVRIMTR